MATDRRMTVEQLDDSKSRLEVLLVGNSRVSLSDGALTSVDVCALSTLLLSGDFPEVETLVLSNNQLTDASLGTLLTALTYITSVIALDVSSNCLTQRGVYHLLLSLTNLNDSLKILSLAHNPDICGTGISYVGEILENNKSLVELDLSGIEIGRALDSLAKGLRKNSTLKKLNLESTSLNSQDIHSFIDILTETGSVCEIEDLNLSFNPIIDGKFQVFTPLFSHKRFRSLKRLNLSSNQMLTNQESGFSAAISQSLSMNSTMEEIKLAGNLLKYEDCLNLSPVVQKGKLKVLDLRDNNIDLDGAKSLLFDLKSNRTMRFLKLEENSFLDEDSESQETVDKINSHLANNRGEVVDRLSKHKPKPKAKRSSPPMKTEIQELHTKTKKQKPIPWLLRTTPKDKQVLRVLSPHFVSFNFPLKNANLRNPSEGKEVLKKKSDSALSKKSKRGKRKFAGKLKEISALSEQTASANKNMPTLSHSVLEQRIINRNLSSVASFESFADSLRRELKFLPSTVFRDLDSCLSGRNEYNRIDVITLEKLAESVRVANLLLWSTLQLTTGAKQSCHQRCTSLLFDFLQSKNKELAMEDVDGMEILKLVTNEMLHALVLLKPLFSITEALFLVVETDRKQIQPRLSYYDKKYAKLDAKAEKHLHKKVEKAERQTHRENLKKKLLRAKSTLKRQAGQSQANGQNEDETQSKASNGSSSSLTKVLDGVQKKLEKQQKQQRSSRKVSRKVKVTREIQVPENVQKFRDNCPERVEDIVDDLKEESKVFSDLLSISPFFALLRSSVESSAWEGVLEKATKTMTQVFAKWMEMLQEDFPNKVLANIADEIPNEVSKVLQSISGSTVNSVNPLQATELTASIKATESFKSLRSLKNQTKRVEGLVKNYSKMKGTLRMFSKMKKNKNKVKSYRAKESSPVKPVSPTQTIQKTKAVDERALGEFLVKAQLPVEKLNELKQVLGKIAVNSGEQNILTEIALNSCCETVSGKTMKLREIVEEQIDSL